MSKTIALKIDVSKIEKARLYQGKKGTYLDAVLFLDDETDEYGQNGMIVQSVKKEEREAGIKGPILGNCKIIGGGQSSIGQKSEAVKAATELSDDLDSLPF